MISSTPTSSWNRDFETPLWQRILHKIREHPSYYVLVILSSGILLFGSGAFLVGTQSRANPNDEPLPDIVAVEEFGGVGFPTEIPQQGSSSKPSVIPNLTITTLPAKPTITPTPTPDPTATWSAYISTQYGYSIDYPPNWTVTPTTSGDPLIVQYVLFNPSTVSTSSSSITVSYSNRSAAQSLAVYSANSSAISIGTISASQQTVQDSNGNVAYRVVIPDGTANSVVIFGRQAYQAIFNLMIQTFSFL